MKNLPTPETAELMRIDGEAIAQSKIRPAIWPKMQDLERRLSVARDALWEVYRKTKCDKTAGIVYEAIQQTKTMNHPDPHQEASDIALVEEHEAHPERFTRIQIENVSALIQAAKLLGGKYRRTGQRHLIDLPCGRSVAFQEYFNGVWSIFPSWDKSTYTVENQNSALKISRHIRSLVVKNDEQIS